MASLRLGKVQLKILQALWEMGKASAREITDRLNRADRRPRAGPAPLPIAHSTVQTLLRKLEAKGAIGHQVEGRTFLFFPIAKEGEVTRSATREFLDRVFAGSAWGLIAHLLRHERISREELYRIHELLEEKGPERR